MMITNNTALILIDVQQAFAESEHWGGGRNNLFAEDNCGELLTQWRNSNLPIFHIQHCSTDPQSPLHPEKQGNAFCNQVVPLEHEQIITKQVNSSFIGTNLKELLDKGNITSLVIAGLTTDHCVSTTTRMAGNFGYDVMLVADACATFDRIDVDGQKFLAEDIHRIHLASLHNEFATVCTMADVKELLNKN